MFAKVFGQIFDSSIAEDYNCRRMFMDLLVLADPTGAVDMTIEAISRRTNVPLEEVERYISQLCQPDSASRSQLHEGKRLIPLDSNRDWGWLVVNYGHYRKLRDQDALRTYFRDAQREHRKKKRAVKDKGLTELDNLLRSLTPSSSSTSSSVLPEGVRGRFEQWMKYRRALGSKPRSWSIMFAKQIEWLCDFSEADQLFILDQSMRNGWRGLFEPKRKEGRELRMMSVFELEKRIAAISEKINAKFKTNGGKRIKGDGIDELKTRRDELQKELTR
jgi:hypothetical protein